MDRLEELEQAIVDAEAVKREYVKNNPTGTGSQSERNAIYNEVEKARRSLRAYKIDNPHLLKR